MYRYKKIPLSYLSEIIDSSFAFSIYFFKAKHSFHWNLQWKQVSMDKRTWIFQEFTVLHLSFLSSFSIPRISFLYSFYIFETIGNPKKIPYIKYETFTDNCYPGRNIDLRLSWNDGWHLSRVVLINFQIFNSWIFEDAILCILWSINPSWIMSILLCGQLVDNVWSVSLKLFIDYLTILDMSDGSLRILTLMDSIYSSYW